MREIGCYKDLTNEEYHGAKEYISRSAIMDYDKSPYTYWAKHFNPEKPQKDATKQMEMGTAFHTLILEPGKFDKEYIMKPTPVLLKDVGREQYDLYKGVLTHIENCGLKILTVEEWDNLMAMRDKLNANAEAVQLIRDSRIENSFFWQDKHSGLLLKARPDVLKPNIIIDLKTCSDASERTIQNEIFRYGYDVQMAMIRDGVETIEGNKIENFILICIETKYPYNMGIYLLDEEIVNNAQLKYKNLLLQLKESQSSNQFKDYGISRILLPKWAVYG